MAWAKSGSDTLTSGGTSLDIVSFTSSEFNQFLCHDVGTSAESVLWQVGGSGSVDTANNYTHRYSQDGATDGVQNTRNNIWAYQAGTDDDRFIIFYSLNIAGQEKLFIGNSVTFNGAGAGISPNRCEEAGKWANTSVQYDTVKAYSHSGNMDTDSNLTALGSDGVESMTVQDGAVYYETDTNKEYVLYDNTWTEL